MLYGGTYPLSFDWTKELLTQWHNFNLLTSKRYNLSKAQVFEKTLSAPVTSSVHQVHYVFSLSSHCYNKWHGLILLNVLHLNSLTWGIKIVKPSLSSSEIYHPNATEIVIILLSMAIPNIFVSPDIQESFSSSWVAHTKITDNEELFDL